MWEVVAKGVVFGGAHEAYCGDRSARVYVFYRVGLVTGHEEVRDDVFRRLL